MNQNMYTDQTGRFPVQACRSMQYIMILYEIDSRVILVEPLQNKTSCEMVATYQKLVDRLKDWRFEPTLHIWDNETLAQYKTTMYNNGINFNMHLQKIADVI